MPIDQEILDGIRAAHDCAAWLPTELAMIRGENSEEEVKTQLRLVYRMTTELRRQVEHLGQVLENRERGV